MLTLAEIQDKCDPALIAAREHGAISAVLNVGRVKIAQRLGGIGLVLETLGPVDGAALLDSLEAASAGVPALRWAFVLINRGELDFGSSATRAMIDTLNLGAAGDLLKAVAEVPDPVSVADVINALGA